jgi:hypothetical protein
MKIDKVTWCQVLDQDGSVYLVGIQYDLRDSATGTVLQLPYNGQTQDYYAASHNFSCETSD